MKNQTITEEELLGMTYQQMIKICPQLNVKYEFQKKDELISILKDAIKKSKGVLLVESDQKKYGKKVHSILDDERFSKSAKMRLLYDEGIEQISEIAKLTNSHYSFVYTVISKYKDYK